MADFLIRGLGDSVMRRLKARARRNGRSLQKEAKAILEDAGRAGTMSVARAAAARVRRRLRRRAFTDSTALVREDRER